MFFTALNFSSKNPVLNYILFLIYKLPLQFPLYPNSWQSLDAFWGLPKSERKKKLLLAAKMLQEPWPRQTSMSHQNFLYANLNKTELLQWKMYRPQSHNIISSFTNTILSPSKILSVTILSAEFHNIVSRILQGLEIVYLLRTSARYGTKRKEHKKIDESYFWGIHLIILNKEIRWKSYTNDWKDKVKAKYTFLVTIFHNLYKYGVSI